jgi:hypothetical protein
MKKLTPEQIAEIKQKYPGFEVCETVIQSPPEFDGWLTEGALADEAYARRQYRISLGLPPDEPDEGLGEEQDA